jgi:CheY-like chemotaxis protein
LTGYSILLVEPNSELAVELARILRSAGAHVLISQSYGDALCLAGTAELSGAVLDYTESIRDGHRVAARLTELAVPFVFCKDIGRNEAWPHAAVLNKPFSDAELVEMVGRLLDPDKAGFSEPGIWRRATRLPN